MTYQVGWMVATLKYESDFVSGEWKRAPKVAQHLSINGHVSLPLNWMVGFK